jgi:hypothetical protein
MAGAVLPICLVFSASDIRLIRSLTRTALGCEGSSHKAGPETCGICRAAASV